MSNAISPHPEHDAAKFLNIARQGCGVSTYTELWRWLQEDVQPWLPHDALIVGWGGFRAGPLESEIVSNLPGLRFRQFSPPWTAPLLCYLRDCWVVAQRLPCQVDLAECRQLLREGSGPSAQAIAGMRTALVHGTRDGQQGGERIYAALTLRATLPPGGGTALKLLLPFIDTALRRLPPAAVGGAACGVEEPDVHAVRLSSLTGREREIMGWVALGKTNPEIGGILRISEFTVKNHMKSIFRKLDVTHRAQAVAKLAGMTAHA
jgi:transcriptional regulator EpsA